MVHHPQVDRGQLVDAQRCEVDLDVAAQLVGLVRGQPAALIVAAGAHLADECEVVRVGMERLADEFVGHVGSVELRGVDVVDAEFDGPAQHGDRLIVVAGRAEDSGSGELHRTETDAENREVAKRKALHGTQD